MNTYAFLPEYMQADQEVVAMLTTVNHGEYLRLIREYPHPEDQSALTSAWNVVASAATRQAAIPEILSCHDCGAPGHTDRRGLGISCGCAAE